MKIESVRIENFRSIKDQTIYFDDYNCFVGANGAGKSTVLNALNVFFRQFKDSKTDLSKLSAEDFHHKNINSEIKITVTFTSLEDEAKEIFSSYVRQDKLIVTALAKYDPKLEIAEVKQYGSRLGIEKFRRYFEAEKAGAKVPDLNVIYGELKKEFTDLKSAITKQAMSDSLRDYESSKPELCVLIPSEDQFYGVTRGANKLAQFIQWVFIPASKDVTEESDESKNSALGILLARTVRAKVNFDEKVSDLRRQAKDLYQKLLDSEQSALDGISDSLQKRLTSWAHPEIKAKLFWKQDPDKSVKIEEPLASVDFGERGFYGNLVRFGHGLQRSFMLALLQELTYADEEKSPTLIMCIEEPELYQHPPQARYLAETLIELSEKGTQVLVCTHSPLFIPSDNFDKIRIVREVGSPSSTQVLSADYERLSKELESLGERAYKETGMVAKLYGNLNPIINEMFFCKKLILVEGNEDIAHIMAYIFLLGNKDLFRKSGAHIVPVSGKSNMIKPLLIAKLLSIPVFAIFDSDNDKGHDELIKHQKDNKCIFTIQESSTVDFIPNSHIGDSNLFCVSPNLTTAIKLDLGNKYQLYSNKSCAHYGNANDLIKNPLAIAKFHEFAWNDGIKSNTLLDIVKKIEQFIS
ncbi:ATP-dependent endonuclease [Chitinophagaceae bacterium IBVUCB1]|nr:ATP-dependent endonuclease [Chitinophagaceae bacterium IBVUCB1]